MWWEIPFFAYEPIIGVSSQIGINPYFLWLFEFFLLNKALFENSPQIGKSCELFELSRTICIFYYVSLH